MIRFFQTNQVQAPSFKKLPCFAGILAIFWLLLVNGRQCPAFQAGEVPGAKNCPQWVFIVLSGLVLAVAALLVRAFFHFRAEKSLREMARFQAYFDINLVGMTAITAESKWLEVNDKFCEIVGFSREELKRKSWIDLVHPEDLPDALDNFGALCAGEIQGISRIIRFIRKDRSVCHLQLSAKVLRHSDGSIDRIVNIVQDVTDRTRAEDALRLDEARLEALVELNQMAEAPVEKIVNFIVASAIGLTRSKIGYLAFVNESEGSLIKHGWVRGSLQECTLEKPPAGYPIVNSGLWAKAVRHKRPIIINDYNRPNLVKKGCPQGHVSIGRFMGVPLLDHEKVVAVIGVGNKADKYDEADIRQLSLLGQGLLRLLESKRAEEDLRESRREYKRLYQQFQTLLDGIPDSLFLLDPDLTIVWGNKAAADRLKVNIKELQGQPCFCLLAGRSQICPDCPVVRCFASGTTEEGLYTTADGRILGKKAFPLKNAAGEVQNVIEMAVDITEKVRLRKEAERAGRLASLGQLAAGVAHEINNPNGVLMLNAKILEGFFAEILPALPGMLQKQGLECPGGLDPAMLDTEIPQILTDMQDSSRRISRIVKDLKDFVRSESELSYSMVDLNEVLKTTVRLTGNMLKSSTYNLQVDHAPGLPRIMGNFQQLEQVVINLIVNACQALQDKNQGISITSRYDEFGRHCFIEVRDEGEGIDPNMLPHITEPFFTTKRQKGGTGLGLSVSTRIVQEHRGKLEFFSTPGQGTTVRLALPSI
jgi:PAS domain S-box-containing protein